MQTICDAMYCIHINDMLGKKEFYILELKTKHLNHRKKNYLEIHLLYRDSFHKSFVSYLPNLKLIKEFMICHL